MKNVGHFDPINAELIYGTIVPYYSLSWAHTWLGTQVNVTRAPQSVYISSTDITRFAARRRESNVPADYEPWSPETSHDICTPSSRSLQDPSFYDRFFQKRSIDEITFYEHSEDDTVPKRTTGVWEIDRARHRHILSHPAFLRELRAELRHVFDGQSTSDKSIRPPTRDEDCNWTFREAKCLFPEYCEYQYHFGDLSLDQSCRLRRKQQPHRALTCELQP